MSDSLKISRGYDAVHKPKHYNEHPSGIECIQVTEHMNFCLGNAVKYIWRADLKNGVEDLEKAIWYLQREIFTRKSKELALRIPEGQPAIPFEANLPICTRCQKPIKPWELRTQSVWVVDRIFFAHENKEECVVDNIQETATS